MYTVRMSSKQHNVAINIQMVRKAASPPTDHGMRFSSPGLCGSKCSDPASSEGDGLESLVNVQLPAVGVSCPSSGGLLNSPKSAKLSNAVSSISSEKEDENVKGSEPSAAAASEKGPNPS
jgi:hypothetical protein